MEWDGRKENYDAAQRFSRRRMTRMAEARRTLDGDVMMLRRRDGMRQMIEGDRVRNPIGMDEAPRCPRAARCKTSCTAC
jgi:hypothetical protein